MMYGTQIHFSGDLKHVVLVPATDGSDFWSVTIGEIALFISNDDARTLWDKFRVRYENEGNTREEAERAEMLHSGHYEGCGCALPSSATIHDFDPGAIV